MFCPFCDNVSGGFVCCSRNNEKPEMIPLGVEPEVAAESLKNMDDLFDDDKFMKMYDNVVEKYFGDMTFERGSETWKYIDN